MNIYKIKYWTEAELLFECFLLLMFIFFCGCAGVWSYLQGTLLRRYAEASNGINVLCGPVFDYNYDGLRDTTEKIKE